MSTRPPPLRGCDGDCGQGRRVCDCGHEHPPTAAMPLHELAPAPVHARRADMFLVAVALAAGAATLGMILGSIGGAP